MCGAVAVFDQVHFSVCYILMTSSKPGSKLIQLAYKAATAPLHSEIHYFKWLVRRKDGFSFCVLTGSL